MSTSLAGKVCIVTGATRGIGKGIALQLAEKGAKVYITGRTLDPKHGDIFGGSLKETAREIETRGGTCTPIQCDHSKDSDVERLFDTVKKENDGQLDILVNNAFSAVPALYDAISKELNFWEQPPEFWDIVNNVGLRNHYICAVYAARMMVPRNKGLIVNVSGAPGLTYVFNCAFGIGKEACDRMAADCAHELRKHNVAFVSLWPGHVSTDTVGSKLRHDLKNAQNEKHIEMASAFLENLERCETSEFVGQCVASLAVDPDLMKMSGKILLTYDLGRKYRLKDTEGHEAQGMTQVKTMLNFLGYKGLASFVPGFIRLPKWLLLLSANKFN